MMRTQVIPFLSEEKRLAIKNRRSYFCYRRFNKTLDNIVNENLIRIIAWVLLIASLVLIVSGLTFSQDPRLFLWGLIALSAASIMAAILQKKPDAQS